MFERRCSRSSLVLAVGVIASICGCGGGSSGSESTSVVYGNRPPVAATPTCSNVITGPRSQSKSTVPVADGVFVPPTSIPSAEDAGRRMHTNHLILFPTGATRGSGPSGFTPVEVAGAYGVSNFTEAGSGAIAVVDAYNYPNALADFNTFSAQFGLTTEPSSSSTSSSNQVFQVVYAGGSAPTNDAGWAQESAGDIEWAHALAPRAKIYLVEAATGSSQDIFNAVSLAKTLPGVREVSESFGTAETACSYASYDNTMVQPGVAFFASAGDTPGIRDYPALSMNAVAVGGTTLHIGANGTWASETVWNQTGCGPSAYEPRPEYQDPWYPTVGLYRGGSDIVAVADPKTGVSVYDSYPYQNLSGWLIFGGTSIATPIVAGIANGSGVVIQSSQALNNLLYAHAGGSYFHVVNGSSGGFTTSGTWSYPSGLGSPSGLGALISGQ